MNRNCIITHSSLLFKFDVTTKSTHKIVDASCARYIFHKNVESPIWSYMEIRKFQIFVLVIKKTKLPEIARIVPEWMRIY